MGTGGGGAQDAAQELLRRAKQQGGLSKGDAAALRELLKRAELREAVGGEVAKQLEQMSKGGRQPLRDVKTLLPAFDRLLDAKGLAARFKADFVLLKGALVDFPGLTHTQQAQRAFDFFGAYAKHLAALHAGEVKGGHGGNRAELVAEFEAALKDLGLDKLVDVHTGESLIKVARGLLMARSADEAERRLKKLSMDAPSWKDNLAADAGRRGTVELGVSPEILTGKHRALRRAKQEEAEEAKRRKGRSGKLGLNMLWNVLHLGRAQSDEERLEHQDNLNRLIISAGLLVLLLAVVAVALVFLR